MQTKQERTATEIHPTAIVHPKAKLGKGVKIGPYSVVGEGVVLGDQCELMSHVVVEGLTTIGSGGTIHPFAVVGGAPQHLRYEGEPSTVVIGEGVTIRECVTVNRGTALGHNSTTIGANTYIMAYAHVAHDCIVGSNVILCNTVQLAGHVTIEDFATLGGASEVSQHCRVGRYCFVAGGSTLRKDLPPFLTGKGNDFQVQGINSVGLQRQGFQAETVTRLKNLYKIFYMQPGTVAQAIEKATMEFRDSPEVGIFLEFIRNSKMGFVR